MAILIDTSAWIEFFRGNGCVETKKLVRHLVASRNAAYTCPVLYELLVGVLPHEERLVREILSNCQRVVFTSAYWEGAATLGQKLLRKGVTVTPGDVQIAFVAVDAEMPLLCRDKHFDLIRKVLGSSLELQQLV